MRPDKITWYMNIAKEGAMRSPCTRRKCCALLIKNDSIIAMGYNGSIRGAMNCGEEIPCLKDIHDEAHYTSFEYCPAVHAEQNVIINAARAGVSTLGSTLIFNATEIGKSDRPCHLCRRYMIQAGIKDCYYVSKEGETIHENVEIWVILENDWMREKLNEGREKCDSICPRCNKPCPKSQLPSSPEQNFCDKHGERVTIPVHAIVNKGPVNIGRRLRY